MPVFLCCIHQECLCIIPNLFDPTKNCCFPDRTLHHIVSVISKQLVTITVSLPVSKFLSLFFHCMVYCFPCIRTGGGDLGIYQWDLSKQGQGPWTGTWKFYPLVYGSSHLMDLSYDCWNFRGPYFRLLHIMYGGSVGLGSSNYAWNKRHISWKNSETIGDRITLR